MGAGVIEMLIEMEDEIEKLVDDGHKGGVGA